MVEYLSPSSIALYRENPNDYYLRYLAKNKPLRAPQTQPMSIGSSFDAYVKSYLYDKLYGKKDERYVFETLFEAQVEHQHRDWALKNGRYVFEQYRQSGCLGDLMLELQQAQGEPRFEFEIKGTVQGYREAITGSFTNTEELGEVTLLGRPDVDFITKSGVHCILDFKVNGYCSKYPRSPVSHYMIMRSAGKTNHGQHKKCVPMVYNGLEINVGCYLEDIEESWARQLAIYGWLTGEPVGSDFVTIIHQLVCSPNPDGLPYIRVAEHLNKVGKPFQKREFNYACNLWEIVHSDWFFRDMTREESQARCALIDDVESHRPDADSLEGWIDGMGRQYSR